MAALLKLNTKALAIIVFINGGVIYWSWNLYLGIGVVNADGELKLRLEPIFSIALFGLPLPPQANLIAALLWPE